MKYLVLLVPILLGGCSSDFVQVNAPECVIITGVKSGEDVWVEETLLNQGTQE